MKLLPETILVSVKTSAEAMVGNELVLLSLDAGECVGLDETAREVWQALAHPTPFQHLVTFFTERYEGPPAVIEADLADTVQRLYQLKLVEIPSAAHPA